MASVGCASASRQPRSPSRPQSVSAKFPTKFRIRHNRTRTGCVTCRRRKKKCDESHPICSGCVRNGLDCSWPKIDQQPEKRHGEKGEPSCEGENEEVNTQNLHLCSLELCRVSPSPLEGMKAFSCESGRLFEHYLTETAVMIFAGVLSPNPFITCVLPLALTNSLLMHAVLAVSGSHLSFKLPESTSLQLATQKHYVQVLRGVQALIAAGNSSVDDGILPLVIALLCEYEVLSCSPANTVFLHLNAARDLLNNCRGISRNPNTAMAEDISDAQNLAHETLAYFILSNTMLPFSEPSKCPCEQFTWPLSGREASWSLFGAVFGGSYSLFQLIPEIKNLYCLRLIEESQGIACPSQHLRIAKDGLIHRIDTWNMDPLPDIASADDTTHLEVRMFDWEQKRKAAECLRQALYIYAALSLTGSSPPSSSLKEEVQCRIDNITSLATYLQDLSYSTNLLWAVIMAGSCMEDKLQQDTLIDGLQRSRYQMRHLQIAQKALQLLWADATPNAYGPNGLRHVVEKHDLSLVMV